MFNLTDTLIFLWQVEPIFEKGVDQQSMDEARILLVWDYYCIFQDYLFLEKPQLLKIFVY